jgi:hypothetical protein
MTPIYQEGGSLFARLRKPMGERPVDDAEGPRLLHRIMAMLAKMTAGR